MKQKIMIILKIFITIAFIGIFVLRIFKPDIKIDTISIILLLLAFLPWVMQFIKSLEINGIGKVELVDKEKKEEIETSARNTGIILKENKREEIDLYSFYNLRQEDPKLALAGLRIEIEDRLRTIAKNNALDIKNVGLYQLTNILSKNQLLDHDEISIINDLTGILNKAVHSQLKQYDYASFDWVFNFGLKLIASLDEKINKKK